MPFVQAKVHAIVARDDVARQAHVPRHLSIFWTLLATLGLPLIADKNQGVALQNRRAMGCLAALTRGHIARLAPQRGLDLLVVFTA